MATKLIGADDASGSNEGANWEVETKFQALTTGEITEFRVKTGASSQVKVAVYADNSGSPGARLSYNNTAQNVVSGWNTLSIPSLVVTSGTYYWLAIATKDAGAVQYIASDNPIKYSPITFSTFSWPDPSGATTSYHYTELVAGWGTATGWANIKNIRMGTGVVLATDIANIRMGTGSIAVADVAEIPVGVPV